MRETCGAANPRTGAPNSKTRRRPDILGGGAISASPAMRARQVDLRPIFRPTRVKPLAWPIGLWAHSFQMRYRVDVWGGDIDGFGISPLAKRRSGSNLERPKSRPRPGPSRRPRCIAGESTPAYWAQPRRAGRRQRPELAKERRIRGSGRERYRADGAVGCHRLGRCLASGRAASPRRQGLRIGGASSRIGGRIGVFLAMPPRNTRKTLARPAPPGKHSDVVQVRRRGAPATRCRAAALLRVLNA